MNGDILSLWWVWASAALILAILEVMVPGFIFLGFAIGAAIVGAGLFVLGMGGLGSIPVVMVIFAALSLAAWLILRRVFSLKTGQVKTFYTDIND